MKLRDKIPWLMGRLQRSLFPCLEECCITQFAPYFRIELHIKDFANVLETSHELGHPLPSTAFVMEIM